MRTVRFLIARKLTFAAINQHARVTSIELGTTWAARAIVGGSLRGFEGNDRYIDDGPAASQFCGRPETVFHQIRSNGAARRH